MLQTSEESPGPASFFATYAYDGNDHNTVEPHGQVADEDEAMIPAVPMRARGEATKERSADGVAVSHRPSEWCQNSIDSGKWSLGRELCRPTGVLTLCNLDSYNL